MVSLGSVCPYIKYYCLFSGNTSAQSNTYILRDSSMAATLSPCIYSRQSPNRANPVLDASPQSPADLSTGRLVTTLLPSLFLRSGVCGEIVNELARICTSSFLIFQKNLVFNRLYLFLSLPNARKDGAV